MNHEQYTKLFPDFLARSPKPLVEAARPTSPPDNPEVLDLCCGNGRLGVWVLEHVARSTVTFVDSAMDTAVVDHMNAIRNKHNGHDGGGYAHYALSGAEEYLAIRYYSDVDAIFCQQAINYWFSAEGAEMVAETLKPNGVFVFNTFNTPPDEQPTVCTYSPTDGRSYLMNDDITAVTYRIGDLVYTTRHRPGVPPMTQCFDWISREQFASWLDPWFEVERRSHNNSDLYICRRTS